MLNFSYFNSPHGEQFLKRSLCVLRSEYKNKILYLVLIVNEKFDCIGESMFTLVTFKQQNKN